MTPAETQSREEFEKWATTHTLPIFRFPDDHDLDYIRGNYVSARAHAAWLAWSARDERVREVATHPHTNKLIAKDLLALCEIAERAIDFDTAMQDFFEEIPQVTAEQYNEAKKLVNDLQHPLPTGPIVNKLD